MWKKAQVNGFVLPDIQNKESEKGGFMAELKKKKRIPIDGTKASFTPEHGCGSDGGQRLKEKLKGVKLPPKEPLDPRVGNLKRVVRKKER